MKLVEIADKDKLIIRRTSFAEPSEELRLFVDQFYTAFLNDPLKASPVISIEEEGDADRWPKTLAGLSTDERKKIRQLIFIRLRDLKRLIKQRVMEEHPKFMDRHRLFSQYVGNGRVALYWHYVKSRK